MKSIEDFKLKKANVVSIYGGCPSDAYIPTQTLIADGSTRPNDCDDTGDIG